MANVQPFKAIRATRDKVALVSSRSYDAYSSEELETQLQYNPFSFLHIINPSYDKSKNISAEEKFVKIKNTYEEFKNKHTYIKEEKSVFYIYKKITASSSFIGIIAATSTNDYGENIIKKHEETLKKREILFKNYLKATGFNAEPVLLTYPNNEVIDSLLLKYQKKRAEYEFTTENNKTHLLWIVDNEIDIKNIIAQFKNISSLYIADGHHRSASSYLLAKNIENKNKNHTGKEAYNFCLSYLISENNLQIFEFNRLVKGLNGFTSKEFLNKLNENFIITKLSKKTHKPNSKHTFSMYLEQDLYQLQFKPSKKGFKSSLHELDTHILYKYVLKKILGIENVRKDKKISYANSNKGQEYLKEQVTKGNYSVAFGLVPITIKQLKKVADAGLKMPPKSTYILPKLRSGLVIYEF